MTSYGKIEIMEFLGKRSEEALANDILLESRHFTEDNANISRCIHRPDGMISLSAGYLAVRYELQFMEQTPTEAWINKNHGSYSISDPFQGIGHVVKLCRLKELKPFSQFYHIITSSNKGHLLMWRIGIVAFSKEVTKEDLLQAAREAAKSTAAQMRAFDEQRNTDEKSVRNISEP
jgi:hypothetical protein